MIKNKDYWKSLATRNPTINAEEQREIQETLNKQHWLVKFFMRSRLWRDDDYGLIYYFRKDYAVNNLPTAKKHLLELLCYFGLVVGCVVCVISLLLDLKNSEYLWFQRSGAMLVFFALISEFSVARAPELKPNEISRQVESYRLRRIRKISRIFGLILATVGTVIWAYGDLPFSSACN